jgi:hypothetical protein
VGCTLATAVRTPWSIGIGVSDSKMPADGR